jgi:hypothetical protein
MVKRRPSFGVTKYATKKLTVTTRPESDAAFLVAVKGALTGTLILELDEAVRSTLGLFLSFAVESDAPVAERLDLAEDQTKLLFSALLDRAGQSLADMFEVLLNESLFVSSRGVELNPGASYEDEPPPLDKPSTKIILKQSNDITRRRLNVRAQGPERRVLPMNVFQAVLTNGGEDAKAKDVAKVLGITDRQLRTLRREYGFDNWPELVGYVLRKFGRK